MKCRWSAHENRTKLSSRERRSRDVFVALLVIGLTLAAADSAHAQAPQDEIVYIDTDGIGSVRLVTNQSGNVLERHDFQPFGQETPQPTQSNPLFAGKDRDASGLDYSGARYFAAKLGRFTATDPIWEELSDPQGWNRYVYARNNPLRFIDPEGLCWLFIDDRLTHFDECIKTTPTGSESFEGVNPGFGDRYSDAEYQGPEGPNFITRGSEGVAIAGGAGAVNDGVARQAYAEASQSADSATRELLKVETYSKLTRVGKEWTELAWKQRGANPLAGKSAAERALSAARTSPGWNKAGMVSRVAGPALLAAGVAASAYNIASAPAGQRASAAAGEAGAWAGALAGAKMGADTGAWVGLFFGPYGPPAGAFIGGLLGAAGGAWVGGGVGSSMFK